MYESLRTRQLSKARSAVSDSVPESAVVLAGVQKVITHADLGYIPNVWALNAANDFVDVDVSDATTSGFKVDSASDCTVYYG